jgi:caa(3)-type oxidase subunit IV
MTTRGGHTTVKTYLMVFGGLLLLTACTVGLSYAHLPLKVGIGLAFLIALLKCALIMAFFMHMRSEPKAIHAVFFTALFLALFLGVYLLPDIAFTE